MFNVTQRLFNGIARDYPVANRFVQRLFEASPEECDELYDMYWLEVQKMLPDEMKSYAGVVLDALILTISHESVRMFQEANYRYFGAVPVTETVEQALALMIDEDETTQEVRSILVSEVKRILTLVTKRDK